ncbi:hypothetical protein [Saccharomonospora glauca]|nr:hypothetical protein [Saccharomonospora glauca]
MPTETRRRAARKILADEWAREEKRHDLLVRPGFPGAGRGADARPLA